MTSRSVVRRLLAACYVLVGVATLRVDAISSPWRPISPPIATASIIHREAAIYGNLQPEAAFDVDSAQRQIVASSLSTGRNHCALYKVSMAQQLYFEYIHYKIDLPDIKEFTLCMWAKFHNHTNDHPLFSYAVDEQPRGILFWVANTPRSSYYMMNVDGHNLYRLNYPLRLNKWYHSCQSWNGRTGEWQIWVNDERVGRGFNNRLVGHVIKGGGIAITGQEQRQLGGGFLEGEGAPPGSGGMLGEVTMVQLYNIALTAGKAHRDHKHHHAHHYEHDVTNNAPRSTTRSPMTVPPLTSNPFLTGGQINTQVKINPGAPLQIVQNGVILRHPALPVPRESSPQPFPPANPDSLSTAFPLSPSIPRPVQDNRFYASSLQQSVPNNIGSTDSAISFVDNAYRNLFKREKSATKRRSSANEEADGSSDLEKPVTKREINGVSSEESTSQEAAPSMELNDEKKLNKRDSDKKKKRGLIPFSDSLFLDDGYSVPQGLENDYFSGLANFGLQLPQQHETKDEEREPAEAEVKQVMDICSGCAEEPFEKALIMGWRSVPKKIYSGAYYLPAIPACKAF